MPTVRACLHYCAVSSNIHFAFVQQLDVAMSVDYSNLKEDNAVQQWIDKNSPESMPSTSSKKTTGMKAAVQVKGSSRFPNTAIAKFYDKDLRKLPKPSKSACKNTAGTCGCVDCQWEQLPDKWGEQFTLVREMASKRKPRRYRTSQTPRLQMRSRYTHTHFVPPHG
jgi:hypothetical protein